MPRIHNKPNSDAQSRAIISTNSIGFIHFNGSSQPVQSYRINMQESQNADDSLAHLLLSSSTYSEPTNLFIPFKPSFHSEELQAKKCISEENDYSDNPIENDTLKSNVNDYCYIPTGLIFGEKINELDMKCNNPTFNALNSSTPCGNQSNPVREFSEEKLESIKMNLEEKNVYEVPSKIASPNEYTVCNDETSHENIEIEQKSSESDCDEHDYQIPLNIPTLQRNPSS